MNKVGINDNIEKGHEQEQENENENEKTRLKGVYIIEYYNNKNDKKEKNLVNSNEDCTKIIIIILSLFFFLILNTVDILYKDKSNLENLKLKLDQNKNNFDKNKNPKITPNNTLNSNLTNKNINNTKKETNDRQNKNYTINDFNISRNQNNTKKNINNKENVNNNKNNINVSKDKPQIERQQIKNDITYKILNKESKNNYTGDMNKNNETKKIGLAFVYTTLYSNGIARFITLTSNYFIETGRYDIYFITSKPTNQEYPFNPKIKRFIAHDNYTLIKNITKHEHIDIVILQNVLSRKVVNFYKKLKIKVVGIFHGVYMSIMFHGMINSYRNWNQFDLYDSFVFIASDDYYFYKNLGFQNAIFIPNLYTFEPSQIKNSNLTYNNIIMLGRLNDEIKGAKYAIMAMSYIVKEVPDAKLNLITSDSRIQFLKNLTKELNLTNNVFIHYHTYNISEQFWNSSVHMYTSLAEAFPMALNEGKAHGLPIVAFDVPFSNPYQDGVIKVDMLDIKALANETIALFKDYNYRKRMGEYAKKSLNMFSNKETVKLWGRLFNSLLSEDKSKYRELQKEIENKYYNEEKAKEHMEKHYQALLRYNNTFSCHPLSDFVDPKKVKFIKECKISSSINKTKNSNSN